MDETTVAELIQLLQNESASIDTQFQLWTTITSAVLIASFAARPHLSFSLKMVIAVMYLLASATIGLRYANDASQFEFLMGELRNRGVDYPAFVDLRFLRIPVYSVGTVATLAFLFFRSNARAREGPDAESGSCAADAGEADGR